MKTCNKNCEHLRKAGAHSMPYCRLLKKELEEDVVRDVDCELNDPTLFAAMMKVRGALWLIGYHIKTALRKVRRWILYFLKKFYTPSK